MFHLTTKSSKWCFQLSHCFAIPLRNSNASFVTRVLRDITNTCNPASNSIAVCTFLSIKSSHSPVNVDRRQAICSRKLYHSKPFRLHRHTRVAFRHVYEHNSEGLYRQMFKIWNRGVGKYNEFQCRIVCTPTCFVLFKKWEAVIFNILCPYRLFKPRLQLYLLHVSKFKMSGLPTCISF